MEPLGLEPLFNIVGHGLLVSRRKDRELANQIYARLLKSLRPEPVPEVAGVQAILDSSLNPQARTAKAQHFMDTKLLDEIKASGAIERFYRR